MSLFHSWIIRVLTYVRWVYADIDFTGKETGQHMMDPPASPHTFQQSMHHQDQIQRVVSPANQLAHYQAQYAGYETYHRTEDVQHDPRQQVPTPLHTPDFLL